MTGEMSIIPIALLAPIAVGIYQSPQSQARARVVPGVVAPVAKAQPEIRSVEPPRGCQGERDLRVTIKGSGFAGTPPGFQVSLGGDTKVRVLAVRPDAIDLSVMISTSASPGPRQVSVLQRGAEPAVLPDGFTVSTGVDLTLDTPTRGSDAERLVLDVPVKNIGCATSGPTIVLGVLKGTQQQGAAKVPSLGAGASQVAQIVFTLAAGQAASEGSVALTVDPGQEIAESDETNNQVVWVGQIPATPSPPAPVVVPVPVNREPVPAPSDGTPIWPWILGGCVAIGAGALAAKRIADNWSDEKKTQGSFEWIHKEGRFEGHLDYPANSQPFCLSIAVVPGSATHSLVFKAAGDHAEMGT